MMRHRSICFLVTALVAVLFSLSVRAADPAPPAWVTAKTVELPQSTVTLSRPVLVGRSTERLWFPTLVNLGDGRLAAIMSIDYDTAHQQPRAKCFWSDDHGLSWSAPVIIGQPDSVVHLANGDCLLLPIVLRSHPQGMSGLWQVISRGSREIRTEEHGVLVTGLPRPPKTIDMGDGSYAFGFNGQTVTRTDGRYLATLYGRYVGDAYYHLITAASTDGKRWEYLSTIATPAIIPRGWGAEGPCEAALCRLKDGRLLCIFRIGSGKTYGQAWSDDDGTTWTKPTIDAIGDASLLMTDATVRSVQPSLVTLQSGAVALSGGRPGVFVWINEAGDGKEWARIDLSAHHNACHPDEPHVFADGDATKHSTSAYTELVALENGDLLLIYDRLRGGWDNLAADQAQTNSVWVVRLTVKSKR